MKKSNIASFLAGALLFGSIGVFAGQYVAYENPFPIQLNGENVSIEGYNIEGRTYFQLRDMASVIGGFDVDFNNDTIQISKDGYSYDNTTTVPAQASNVFVDNFPIYDEGSVQTFYDFDFDGKEDKLWLIQSRAYDNSPYNDLEYLSTSLVINDQMVNIDNAYKTHGCQKMIITDIDPYDNALDIIILMTYDYTDIHLYQYRNGQIYTSEMNDPQVGMDVMDSTAVTIYVNDPATSKIGFGFYLEDDYPCTYVKVGTDSYDKTSPVG